MNAVFFSADGKILRVQSVYPGWEPPSDSPQTEYVLLVDEACSDATHYVDTSSPTSLAAKGASSVSISKNTADADGVDTVTLSGIPNPSEVIVLHDNGHSRTTVTDGSLNLTFVESGTFTVIVESVTEIDFTDTVEAT